MGRGEVGGGGVAGIGPEVRFVAIIDGELRLTLSRPSTVFLNTDFIHLIG